MEEQTLRLFVGVELPVELKQYLLPLMQHYQVPEVRLVPEQNLHLTTFFIGNVAAARLPQLLEQMKDVAAQQQPFLLQLKEITPGPSPSRPRLVWAKFRNSEEFGQLMRSLQQLLAPEVGLPGKSIPHITLGRIRKNVAAPKNLPVLVPEAPIVLQVKEMAMWKSVLGSPHPTYSVLETVQLGNTE